VHDESVRRDLPSGTVTFLFTDVEGSTRLLEEVGANRYGVLLAEHHRLCREAWTAHRGVEVDTAGDAFFVAFDRPLDALAAAGRAQELLRPVGLRVRMGVHTGEVTVAETGYVGVEVHRAARIAAAASGGQVLVSSSTAALVELPLRDLGEHRFKDLRAPERIFQLGDAEFPPVRSLQRSNMPVPATPFLGRGADVEAVAAWIVDGNGRVVTLTGPGGTGKTRLALQAAAEVSDGFVDCVWWVPLAPLRDPSLVLSELASTLELPFEDGPLLDALCLRLRDQNALVLLDNAEHLLPRLADVVADLVRGTVGPRFLITSRERLQLSSEVVYPVSELGADDAVTMFLDRARAAGVELTPSADVEELCARLERLPLALELAAARTVVFAPAQLLKRLGQRLDLLRGTRDADPRQSTLRATIDWSYELLSDEEREVLRALSLFAGGCTFEAAETVAGTDPDTIQSLLQKSLLRRRTGHATERYWMLETVCEYARERLDGAGETEGMRAAHARWVLGEVAGAGPHLIGPDQLDWLAVLDDELGNLRAATAFALERGDAELAFSLTREPSWYWTFRGLTLEHCDTTEAVLALPGLSPLSRCRALLLVAQASIDPARREAALTEAEQLVETIDDATIRGRALEIRALSSNAGTPEENLGRLERARTLFEQVDDPDEVARIAINIAVLQLELGRLEDARATGEEAVSLSRTLGNRHKLGIAQLNLAETVFLLDSPDQAIAPLREAMTLIEELGERAILGSCLVVVGRFALAAADPETAARLLGAAEEQQRQAGTLPDRWDAQVRQELHRTLDSELGDLAVGLIEEGARLDYATAVALANHVLDVSGAPG
jgi:predicted ATPase/class 3 adenylate cyclase